MAPGSPRRANRKNRLTGAVCPYCGKRIMKRDITLDHIIPLSKGGHPGRRNKIVACRECNELKADYDPRCPDEMHLHWPLDKDEMCDRVSMYLWG